MKKANIILSCIILLLLSLVTIIVLRTKNGNNTSAKPQAEISRQTLQVPIIANSNQTPPSIAATKLPQFTYSLADQKFDSIVTAASNQVKNLIDAKFVHTAYAQESIDAKISVDKEKRKLIVQPKSIPNFTPGMYKLSLTLRTLEGNVNVNQDFTWGVIAVNTNKSMYKPGETAKIGIGVLNDKGDTLCMTGFLNRVDGLTMTITDPKGSVTNLSIKDQTIFDSGKCGANTVTNQADFQANYKTIIPGIYQMKVIATVYGKQREIEDYFKVNSDVAFDIERTSFPTRIYPHALYPVTFTVTALQDYQGTVEDMVPFFFGIEHISDNGTIQQEDSFTKIRWNTKLTQGQAKTFTYYIKFPMISPEFYLLGPITVGDSSTHSGHFMEARQWQIASDAINSSTGQATYEDNGSQNTWFRIWSGTTFGTQTSMSSGSVPPTPTNSKWFSEVSSPLTGEKLVAVLDADTTDVLYVYRWDPNTTTWNNDLRIVLTVTTLNPTRGLDIAYEQLSGDAIFVYSDGTSNQLKYYKRISGTWDGAASNAGTAYSTLKNWVKLVPEANSDNILLGYLNSSNFVGAMIWDGTNNAWTNQIPDNTGTTASGHTEESFAMAWESSNQIPMIIWGTGGARLEYRRFTGALAGGSWSAETNTGRVYNANVDWVNASTDPRVTSNNIAVGTMNVTATSPDCEFTVWDGSTWTYDSLISCAKISGNGNHRSINVAFESNTGQAIWAFVAATDSGHLRYTRWNGSFAPARSKQPATTGTAQTSPLSIQMYPDPNTSGIVVLYDVGTSTANAALWDVEWDGASWSTPGAGNGGAAVFAATNGVQISNESAEAFGFGFNQYLETLAAYKFYSNTDSTDVGTALTAQDTSYIFTNANSDFRLRLLLYYNQFDALGSSARSYKLQFVDPGSGSCAVPGGDGTPASWTDIGTGSSTLIAYKDNATPADGANLTANASDPTYLGKTVRTQTYEEQNNFSNTTSAIAGDQVGEWDFALHDNTVFDKNSQTFCFRATKDTGRVLSTIGFPLITTSSSSDVLIQGGSLIQGGTTIR